MCTIYIGKYIASIVLIVNIVLYVSFIAVAMDGRDWYEIIGFHKISHSVKQPCSILLEKALDALKLLKQWCTMAKQNGKSIYSKLLKYQTLPKFYLPD